MFGTSLLSSESLLKEGSAFPSNDLRLRRLRAFLLSPVPGKASSFVEVSNSEDVLFKSSLSSVRVGSFFFL